jgi:hypothetical protein
MKYLLHGNILMLLLLLVAGPLQAAPKKQAPQTKETKDESPGVSIPALGNDHIATIESPHPPYNSKPPTSGPHVPMVARWGIYRSPIPNELQVHNLEDGGVVIQYNCKECNDLVQKLEQLGKEYFQKAQEEKKKVERSRYEHLIVAPYPGMESVIALTAWGKIDKLEQFDEARIKRFIEAYIGIDHHPRHSE